MAEPIEEHVNMAEIARRFGVERQSVRWWVQQKDFPPPASWVTGVWVWPWREVVTWRVRR